MAADIYVSVLESLSADLQKAAGPQAKSLSMELNDVKMRLASVYEDLGDQEKASQLIDEGTRRAQVLTACSRPELAHTHPAPRQDARARG